MTDYRTASIAGMTLKMTSGVDPTGTASGIQHMRKHDFPEESLQSGQHKHGDKSRLHNNSSAS